MGAKILQRSLPEPVGRLWRPAGFAILLGSCWRAARCSRPCHGGADGGWSDVQIRSGPQWVRSGDERAALRSDRLLRNSELDGLDPNQFKIRSLKARGASMPKAAVPTRSAKANADVRRRLVAYVTALRQRRPATGSSMTARPFRRQPSADKLLAEAAAAPSLEMWLAGHAVHAPQLCRASPRAREGGERRAIASRPICCASICSGFGCSRRTAATCWSIPPPRSSTCTTNGEVVDEMRVVVGKAHQPTPMMAATIRFTALNPYWQVPSDLAAERVAPDVVKQGLGYLEPTWICRAVRLGRAGAAGRPVDGRLASGRRRKDTQVRLRQNPGPQ